MLNCGLPYQICLHFTDYLMSYVNVYNTCADTNCVQVRAPDTFGGCNTGAYDPGEHIGHLKREWSAKLAPIIDYLISSGMLDSVRFDCVLSEGDTNHTKSGYILNIIIMCCDITALSDKLENLLAISEL